MNGHELTLTNKYAFRSLKGLKLVCQILADGYPGQDPQHASDLILETIGGTDFVGVRQKSTYTQDRKNGVTYVNYHKTECIQYVAIMDEGISADYCIDPYYA